MTDRFTIEGNTLYFGRDDQRHGFNLGQLTDRSYNALEILNLHADRIEQLEVALQKTEEQAIAEGRIVAKCNDRIEQLEAALRQLEMAESEAVRNRVKAVLGRTENENSTNTGNVPSA